jgi:catechol 2,3-dioxygenase-like lactoylglutathione lyase family enzyme
VTNPTVFPRPSVRSLWTIAVIAGALTPPALSLPNLDGTPPASAQPSRAAPAVDAVASIGITVSDLDLAVVFYTEVLDFTKISESEVAGDAFERLSGVFGARARIARLRLGEESIELTQFLAPEGRPIPADSRSNDRWFQHIAIVVSNMDKAYAHLRRHSIRHASSGPQTLPSWNPNAGGISAFYFKDPDGHVLEVIHFPPDKGDPRWQRPTTNLFLGIDHTAIVVAATERSLAFYRDTLGMTVAGAAENYGTEQEHLNNVFGARLRITALRAARGPGVELLEYLAPADGREYPVDTRANDLIGWHTTLLTASPEDTAARLRDFHTTWVSPGWVADVDGLTDFRDGATVRDPDGHAVEIGTLPFPAAATPAAAAPSVE